MNTPKKQPHLLRVRSAIAASLAIAFPVSAAEVFKADNMDAVDSISSWIGGVVPGSQDTAVWGSAVASPLTAPNISASIAWNGIKVDGAADESGLFTQSAGVVTTIGSGGVNMTSASTGRKFVIFGTALNLSGGLGQSWSVADGATVFMSSLTRGTGGTVNYNLGDTGTGNVVVQSGTTNALLAWATVGNNDFAAYTASPVTVLGTPFPDAVKTVPGASVLAYTQNPNTGASNPNLGASTVTVLDVVNSNTSAAATAVRLTGNWNVGGFRFATAHATGLDWTVASDNLRNINIGNGGIVVAPAVGAKNVIFNGPAQFRFGSTASDFFLQQHNTQGDLILNNPINGSSNNHRIVKGGAGRAIIAGTNSLTGAVYVGAGTLQLGNGGTVGTVGGAVTNNGVLAFNRSDAWTFSQIISGSGSVTNSGSGTLTLSGNNTFTGPVNLNAGTLGFTTLDNLGAGTSINFNGGGLQWSGSNTLDVSSRSLVFGAGGSRFDTNGNNVTLASSVGGGGAGGLTKSGAGTLTLQGANAYSGSTTVNAGKLLVANSSGSATGAGNVVIAAGATLAGTGTISGSVSTSAGSIIEPGNGGVGTLTVGGLSLASGSVVDLEFASTSSHDRVVTTLSNGLTVNGGGLRLFAPASSTPYAAAGTYNLLGFSGAVQGTGPSSLSVLNPQAGYSYNFGSSGGFVTLQIVQDAILSRWVSTGGGSWGSGGNWSNGVASSGYTAQFTTALGAPATVTLDGDRTVNGIVFDSAQGYTVASGTSGSLTFQKSGGAAANVFSGNHTISAPVVLASNLGVTTASGSSLTFSGVVSGSGGFVKDGPGLLSLAGHNTFSGSINAVNGVLGFAHADSLGSGTLTLNGGTLLFNTGNTADISSKTIIFGLNGAAIDTNDNDVVFANSIGNSGTGFFSKTGAGSLTLNADSTYQGDTYLQGGELIIAGNGSLGNDASVLRLNGGTLVPLSTMTLAGATARAINLETFGGGVLVPSGLTLTVSGAMTGSGPLTKSGAGDLSIIANNSTRTGATIIESGAVRLGNDRSIGQTGLGTGAITFSGNAALYLNGVGTTDNGTSFGVLSNAVTVPAGVTAEIRNPARGGYTGVLSGQAVTDSNNVTTYQSGTVNLYVDGVRCETPGQWPNFTGQLNVYKTPTDAGTDTDVYYMTNAQSLANAKVRFHSGVQVYQSYNPPSSAPYITTHNFGELVVDSGAILAGNPVAGRFNAYSIGALNTDSVISGQIVGSIGTYGPAYPILTKVGTGRLTLNNDHMTAGAINVNGGVLDVRGSIASFYQTPGANALYGSSVGNGADDGISLTLPTGDYVVVNPGALTVAAGASIAGNGTLGGAITVNGILRPDSTGDLGGNLTLTGAASLTLASTATTQFDFKGANFTGVKSTSTGANAYAGSLKFNFLGTVFNGSYKVFDLAVAPTGAFAGVSVTTTTASETALTDNGSGVWSGTVGAQSYSFNAATGVLNVTGGSSTVTPGASTLSATAGSGKVDLSWTSASGADTYTVKRSTIQGGPYTNLIANLVGTSYSDTSVTNGTTYYYVVQAKNTSSNLSGSLSNEVSATPAAAPAHTALQTWRFEQFGVYDDTGAVLAGDTEDFDGDGLANLLEYALGTNATVANASPIAVAKSGNFLTLTYPRRSPADAALTYTVQGTNDLGTAFATGTGATVTTGSTSVYTDDVNVGTTGARRFLRLSVSYTAP